MIALVLDNYDSFTWNLVHGLEAAGARCLVHRSDQITLAEVEALRPDRIVLSPGPFGPAQSGICREVLAQYRSRVPILGVCLGMQVIAVAGGAAVVPSGHPVHGKQSLVWHDGEGLLSGLPNPFPAARYHSLIVERESLPAALVVSAWSEDGVVLGCRSKEDPVEGLLFHPESFLTAAGPQIFSNFLKG